MEPKAVNRIPAGVALIKGVPVAVEVSAKDVTFADSCSSLGPTIGTVFGKLLLIVSCRNWGEKDVPPVGTVIADSVNGDAGQGFSTHRKKSPLPPGDVGSVSSIDIGSFGVAGIVGNVMVDSGVPKTAVAVGVPRLTLLLPGGGTNIVPVNGAIRA